MQQKGEKTIYYYMRALHRDIGFFTLGLIVIYSLSGILLIYRDVDFLKCERTIEKKLSADLEPSELSKAMIDAFHIKNAKVTRTEGEMIYVEKGSYNKTTGVAAYTTKDYPFPLNKFVNLHKISSGKPAHWFAAIFGLLFLFLALSSFWMYKKGTGLFRRGIYIAGAGIIVSILVLLL